MKVAIVGGRDFRDYELVKETLGKLQKEDKITEIVSGGARGADTLGEQYANEFNLPTKIFKPDWNLGRGAGFMRNRTIVENSDFVIAFWDGKSKGTENTISIAKERYSRKQLKGLLVVKY